MTFAEWRTLVKLAYQGGEPTHALLMRAVADGSRAIMVRDIESDLALSKSYANTFRESKVRMAGTRIEDDIAAVITEVSGLMPIDADTAAATAILENAITGAYDDFNGSADKWDAYLLQAAIDLQRHIPFYQVRQITPYLVDTVGVTTEGFISRVALPETARMQNLVYGHYYAPLEADVEYEADDKVISNDRVYKVVVGGTLTIYEIGDGLTSTDYSDEELGDLTFKLYQPERDWPVRQMEWAARNRLLAGDFSGGPAYVLPPQRDELWLYPALDDTHRFDLEWVGVAEEFDDADEVLFDRTAAEAAAHYIRQMMYLTELDDQRQAAASLAFYQKALRKAIIDNDDRETGSPTQVQPYDYRRRCWRWGSCFAPISSNPGTGGMDINGQITLGDSSGTLTIRPTAINFTATVNFSGAAGDRPIIVAPNGQNGYVPRGARLLVICNFPETEGLILTFLNKLSSGDDLLPELRFPDNQFVTDGIGTSATFEFVYDGSNWQYSESNIPA